MKREYYSGFGAVFGFTLSRQLKNKPYIIITIVVSLLLFLGTAALVVLPQVFDDDSDENLQLTLERVIFCDMTDGSDGLDTAWLAAGGEPFSGIVYEKAASVEEAAAAADAHTLILLRENADAFRVIVPDDSALGDFDITSFVSYVSYAYRNELILRSGIDPSVLAELYSPIISDEKYTDEVPNDDAAAQGDAIREGIVIAIPYVMLLIMYFMIVMYGQGVATLVILEKTSKLMDFFLVSVKPAAMILGKVLASSVTAFLQMTLWILSFIFGFKIGVFTLSNFFEDAGSLTEFIDVLEDVFAMLNPVAFAIALLIMIAGFLLYCSLASIGGAMASKPDDLSSTNMIFSMIIVFSFLISMYQGSQEGMVSTAKWLIYFPFTAILVTPGRILTGGITLIEGAASFIIVAASAYVFTFIAGKAYEMMTFYRGDPPKPTKLISMLRDYLKKPKTN